MTKINRNRILVSLLILFVIGLYSCQEEEIIEVEKVTEPKATYVTPAKDLDLASQITKLHNRKIKNGRYAGILDKLETDKVLKVETDSSVSYSFNINEPNYYANLIVWEHDGKSYTFLQEFEPNDRFLKYLMETDATDFTNFSGDLVIRNLEGQLISKTTLEDGQTIESITNGRSMTGCSEVRYEWLDGRIVRIVVVYADCEPNSGGGGYAGSDSSGGGDWGDDNNDGIPGGGSPVTGYDPETLEEIRQGILSEVAGPKPEKEYSNKCDGIQDMWDSYPNNEVAGYLTTDGQVLLTNILNQSGGGMSGIYAYDGISYYPSKGMPTNTYSGMVKIIRDNNEYYLIPVVASIHTHTPCRIDGSDGVSQSVGTDDKNFANKYPTINHWVIGCGAVAQYNGTQNYFFNKTMGDLANSCTTIN